MHAPRKSTHGYMLGRSNQTSAVCSKLAYVTELDPIEDSQLDMFSNISLHGPENMGQKV